MSHSVCQACRSSPVEVTVETDDLRQPYLVCHPCAHRLNAFALRPLEWFNLAALHGPAKFLLHDDFYDEHGAADQPQEPVIDAESFPAPTLAEVAHDPERLIDYAMTRYFLVEPVIKALSQHRKEVILNLLQRRLLGDSNPDIKAACYEIGAQMLGRAAERWVRAEWKSFDPVLLFSLAQASASCLPHEEGFTLVVKALSAIPRKDLVRSVGSLAWFRSAQTLDWIEENINDPITEDWGRLAAVSELRWARVVEWLRAGRPLSLIALDALNACWHYDTPLLREFSPKLHEPAAAVEMTRVLESYLQTDPVPRVRRAVGLIIERWEQICFTGATAI